MNRLASLVVIAAGAAILSACQSFTDAASSSSAIDAPAAESAGAATPVASGPARVDATASAGCPGGNRGPAFLIGARDLATASQAVGTGQAASETLIVPASGDLQTGTRFRTSDIGAAFEMCVITSPPARGAALAGIVSGQLQASRFASEADNAFWQNFFDTYFIRPLQYTPTDASGVLRIDVLAGNLRTALASAPSSSGEMLITVTLPDGAHQLSLTVEKR
ncbi:MAG: hypothetical protein IT535_14865 [Bauldia sp.]|nr:hypothetical protein [Bauldia sp.]